MHQPRRPSVHLVALLALMAVGTFGCDPASAPTPDAGEPPPDASTPPDAGPPDAGPQPVVDPSWDGVAFKRSALREGFGEPFALRNTDIDSSEGMVGDDELFVGGRGVALVDRAARETGAAPRWSVDWAHDESARSGGENSWVWDMALEMVDGDSTQDVVVTTDRMDAYAISGATGQVLWHVPLDVEFIPARMAQFWTADGTPAFFPVTGKSAYSMKDGSKLFTVEALTGYASFVVPTTFGSGLAVTTDSDSCNETGCGGFENVFLLDREGNVLFRAAAHGNFSAVAAADLDQSGPSLPPVVVTARPEGTDPLPPPPPMQDEVLVGNFMGFLSAVDQNGVRWTVDLAPEEQDPLRRPVVTAIVAADVGADQQMDIYASIHLPRGAYPGRIVHVNAQGQLQWSVPVGLPAHELLLRDVDEDYSRVELVAAVGEQNPVSQGAVLALNLAVDPALAPEQRVIWRKDFGAAIFNVRGGITQVPNQAPNELPRSEDVLLVGSADSSIHALRPKTGEEAWSWAGGGFVLHTAAGDVDGDGVDEVASVDDRGLIILSNATTGVRRWVRQADLTHDGAAYHVAMGDLTGDGRAEVVALVERYGPVVEFAALEVYSGDGQRILRQGFTESRLYEVHIADLDADGRNELVGAERVASGCGVRVMDVEGVTRWSTLASPSCRMPIIAVGNVDADAALEIAYAEQTVDIIPGVSLLDSDGTQLWRKEFPYEEASDGRFVFTVPGGMVFGGSGAYDNFVVKVAAATGEEVWRATFLDFPDAETPAIPIWGAPLHGTRVDDRDGDGHPEVAISTYSGDVHLLDGASGTVKWTRTIAPRDVTFNERHVGGPVVWVPATETQPPYLLAAQGADDRIRSTAFVLRPDGEVVTSFPLEGRGVSADVGRFTAGQQRGVAVGAGLGVYTYEATKQ